MNEKIAIIGASGLFPGGRDVRSLWEMITNGEQGVRKLEDSRLRAAGVSSRTIENELFVPYGIDFPDVDQFDAQFFGMTRREAELADPQHRVFLTKAWEALEDAGYPQGGPGQTGVFASTSMSTYLTENIMQSEEYRGEVGEYPALIGNDKDFLATRVSYKLGLTGPSMSVQSACSSSLVAVDLACRSLQTRQCDMALAGGVSIRLPLHQGYLFKEGGTFSRDGQCRPFDAGATGMVPGAGCCIVILKRLSDALRDKDQIYAIIAGTAVNNDGRDKVGYAAPGVEGQRHAILQALRAADVSPSEIGYVEAHGTGTSLGDPIEFEALCRAYLSGEQPVRSAAIGSIKANIGHLDAAAGVTGLLKAALVLRHQTIPPQINFSTPNPYLEIERTPFYIPTQIVSDVPIAAAAVTSLGIGGTNAHCILLAPPEHRTASPQPPHQPHLLVLSDTDDQALRNRARELAHYLRRHPETHLNNVCHTLRAGRKQFVHRATVTARTTLEAADALDRMVQEPRSARPSSPRDRTVDRKTQPPACTCPGGRTIALPGRVWRTESFWINPDPPQLQTAQLPAKALSAADSLTAVIDVYKRYLRVSSIGPESDFFAQGGDSLTAVEVVGAINEATGAHLSAAQFYQLRTARKITDYLADTCREDGVLTQIRPGDPEMFLVHPSTGTSAFALALASATRGGYGLQALEYPYDRLDTLRTIPDIAAHYVRIILSRKPSGPYRLGGYSFGGLIALEIAARLRSQGHDVPEVALFDVAPPAAYLHADHAAGLAALPDLVQAAAIVESPHRSEPASSHLSKRMVTTWRMAAEAIITYTPPPFPGRVVLFRAQERAPQLQADAYDPQGWRDYVTGELEVVSVPGNHLTMFTNRHIRAIADAFDSAFSPAAPAPEKAPSWHKPRRIVIFPGQGSQHTGMGARLLKKFPEQVNTAEEILGFSLTELCLENPQGKLALTRYAQPAVYTVNALAYREFLEEGGEAIAALGHSLGEYNALVAAGALTFSEGLALVKARAQIMANLPPGAMAVVTGMQETQLEEMLRKHHLCLDVAAINAPRVVTLSGARDDLDRLAVLLKPTKSAVLTFLNVEGPFHSRFMRPLADEMRSLIDSFTFSELRFPVYANVTAQRHLPGEIGTILEQQIYRPVLWSASCTRALAEVGPAEFTELGPQMTLTPLINRIFAGGS
ncbi:beta-ketoacyl synthase N-terminal-like domain-containing protein [Streptomyces sp. NPDC004787]|uniref:beta-ketoacyl synthase N-terminal-like domain-containing protein n=1 Tax=Streptomyces sp. NPDC004787 TaxID=3154291 RepID=UPI0033B4510D